jgi:hypothetical protein
MLNSKAAENFDYVKDLMARNPIEMILYYIDTSIDYESRDKTITHHIRMLNKWLDFNIKKETQVFISPLYYENDENIIVSAPKKQEKASFDTSYDCFHQLVREETTELQLGKFFIKTSPKAIYYNRVYLKIPEFFANLMGILEEILLAILFLCLLFFAKLFLLKLILLLLLGLFKIISLLLFLLLLFIFKLFSSESKSSELEFTKLLIGIL